MAADSPQALKGLFITFMIVMVLFTFPMCIFCGYQLKKHWNSQFIIKRRKHLILALYMFWCWHSFIEFPIYAMSGINILSRSRGSFFDIIDTISFFVRCFSCSIYPMRLYAMYYDNEYEKILTGKGWQVLIDPDIEKTNWFLANRRHKYGNTFFLLKWITAFIFIYFVIFCIFDYILSLRFMLEMTCLWSIIAIVVAIYYWRKYPKSLDSWNIRAEIKLILKIYLTMPVMLIFTFILIGVGAIQQYIAMFLLFIPMECIMCAIFYVLVPYSVAKENGYFISNNDIKMMETTINATSSIGWRDIVQTNNGYQQFGTFLQNEWSVENLLFITEYVQLKHVLLQKPVLRNIIEESLQLKYMIHLPESTPISITSKKLSELIHNEHITDAFIEATYKLYMKYIDDSAALQLNLSSRTKTDLVHIFAILVHKKKQNNGNGKDQIIKPITDTNEMNHNDSIESVIEMVLPELETAVTEITYLMQDSYIRFKSTSIFNELTKENQNDM